MSFRDRTRQQENQYETLYVLKKDSGFILELPGGEKGPTKFRVFPAFDKEGKELPMRIGRDDGFGHVFFEDSDFTPWIYPEFGVRRAGSKGSFTAFFRLPGKSDQDPSPLRVFWTTMRKAIWNDKDKGATKFPASWYNWIGSKTDKKIQMEAALKRPGWLILLQGICYGNRGKDYVDAANNPAPKYPCAYLGTTAAMKSFEEMLNQKKPGVMRAQKLEDFLIQDLISCANGFQLDIAYTDTGTLKTYKPSAVAAAPLDLTWTRSQRKPWDEVINLMDETEQIGVLCNHFEWEAVDFALRGSTYEQLLPSDVRGAWDRMKAPKTTAPGPITSAPATQATQPPKAQPAVSVPPPPAAQPSVAGAFAADTQGAPSASAPAAASPAAAGAPAPFAGNVPASGSPAATPFDPSVPPPPPAGQPAPQPAGNPTGDATTDMQNMESIKQRLAAAQQSLDEPSAETGD